MEWIGLFNPHELQRLIGGEAGKDVDFDDLQRNTYYAGGYHESQPVMQVGSTRADQRDWFHLNAYAGRVKAPPRCVRERELFSISLFHLRVYCTFGPIKGIQEIVRLTLALCLIHLCPSRGHFC